MRTSFGPLLAITFLVSQVFADSEPVTNAGRPKTTYSKDNLVPVTCLNRTISTGEHIKDDHGALQYIPFFACNETVSSKSSAASGLTLAYGNPQTLTCTIASLDDEFYHLLEYFVHSDVPLSCRIPSRPITAGDALADAGNIEDQGEGGTVDLETWTPLTIALQGTLQKSHLHLHTNINVLVHTAPDIHSQRADGTMTGRQIISIHKYIAPSHVIAATAYSLPVPDAPPEGIKVVRNEPLQFTFNVAWVPGSVLPGMLTLDTKKIYGGVSVTDHGVGFSLLSLFTVAGSAGVGALVMLIYERRKRGKNGSYANGLLGGNIGSGAGMGESSSFSLGSMGGHNSAGNGAAVKHSGYGGYGGYSGPGKRD